LRGPAVQVAHADDPPFGSSLDNGKLLSVSVVGRNVIFFGESISIKNIIVDHNALIDIYASDGSQVDSQIVTANSTISFQPPEVYGLFTVRCRTSYNTGETWFWLQDISNLKSLALPHMWTWQNIEFTLDANYVVRACLNGKQLSVSWLQSLIALNPKVAVSNNLSSIRVHLTKGANTLDYWMLNTYFGLTFRIQGSLPAPTTINVPISFIGSSSWKGNAVYVKTTSSNLIYSWDDILTRSTGVTFNLADKRNSKLSVTLQSVFDIEDPIFSDGFESNSFNAWGGTDGTTAIVTTPVHSGTYAAKATGSGSDWWEALGSSYADLYVRGYFQLPSLPTAGNSVALFEVINAAFSDAIWVYAYTGAVTGWDLRTVGSGDHDVDSTININQWYCVEVRRLVGDASHGHVTLWIDGTPIKDLTETVTGNSQYIYAGNHGSGDAGLIVYGDDYVKDSSYIGTMLSVVSTVSDIFVVNRNNFVNVTVTDPSGRTDIANVTIQVYTAGDAQNFILLWNQVTNTFSEYSDPSGIVTINAAGSSNATYSTNGWVVNFNFKFTTGFTSGACRVVSTVMNTSSSAQVNNTNLFNVGYVNRVFVSFDDGWLSQYTNAAPVMNSYSINATFYIIYSYPGTSQRMTWTQIATLVSEGYEIGSHSRTHPDLNHVSASQLTDETATVKNDFLTNHTIVTLTFTYPQNLGYNNATVTSALASAGYIYAKTGNAGTWSRSTGIKMDVNAYVPDETTTFTTWKSWVNHACDDTEVGLVYHNVGYAISPYVTLGNFTQEMAYLHNKGFTTLPTSQVGSGIPITFLQTGVGTGTTGTVLTLNGAAYTLTQFPIGLLGNSGDPQTVAASTPLSAASGEQYAFSSWTNGDGLSGASGTYTTPGAAITVTANYNTQYYLTLNPPTPASGPTDTTVTLTSSAPFAVQDAGPCTITSSPAGLISSPTCSIDSSGNLASSFVVSANAPGGIYSLTVTGLHGDYASTSFTVTAQIALALSPTSGSPPVDSSPGTEVTVSGVGFKPSGACTISAQAGLIVDTSGEPACNVNANGLLSAKFKVGAGSTYSVGYIVTLTGPGGDSATGTFSVNPRIVLSPNPGSTGVSVSVKGSGFTPNAGSCSLTGMPVSGGLTCNQAGDGTVAGQFSVASVTAGLYPITVNDAAGTPSASATFTITSGPVISLSPSMGPTGTTVTVSGSGWNPADTSVTFANADLFDGTKTCAVSGGSIASGCSFIVKSSALGGIWTVTFTGTLGDSAQAQFTVQSTFIVNPNNGGPGTTGTLSGSGYTTTMADCGGDISASPPLFSSTRCAIDSNGIITGTFTVDASASSGSHTVTISGAEVEQGSISVTFTVSFTVTPLIVLSPSSGPAGTVVSMSGSGFPTTNAGSCTLSSTPTPLILAGSASCMIGTDGSVTGSFIVASTAPGGPYTVTVTSTVGTSNTATGTFTVIASITLSPVSGSPAVGTGSAPDGAPATTVTVTGYGFSSSDTSCSFTATPVTLVISSPTCTVTGSTGTLTGKFTVGAGSTYGASTVTATGTPAADTSTASFSVVGNIVLNPTSGSSGSTIGVFGAGFSSTADTCGVGVSITGTPVGATGTCTKNADGTFAGQFTVQAVPLGSYFVTYTDNEGGSAYATFTVTTYSMTFQESGIPSGVTWGVTVGGTRYTATGSSFTLASLTQPASYSYDSTVPGASGVQYVCTSGCSGSVTGSTTVTANYKTQYYLTVNSAYDSPNPTSNWFDAGISITASVTSPVSAGTGTQYVCTGWTGSGSVPSSGSVCSVSFNMNAPSSITWNWKTQYYLTMQANPSNGGTVSPGSNWWDSRSYVPISATANSGWQFTGWTGSGSGSCSGSCSGVTVNGPITETAAFGQIVQITITSSPTGSSFVTVDSTPITTPQVYSWVAGSSHTIAANSPVSCGSGCQYVWTSWSDGGGQSHTVRTPSSPVTFTAAFKTQYYLTMQVSPSSAGTTSPSVGTYWYDAGSFVPISAMANSGYGFSSWSGSGSGSYTGANNPASVIMNSPITETAKFIIPMSVSYSVVGGGTPTAPVFRYVLSGVTKSLTLSMTSKPVSVDAGTTWSVTPNPLGGSTSSQGWYSNQPLTGTASSTTVVFTFYRQTLQTLSYSVSGGGSGYSSPTFQTNQFGSSSTVTLTTTATKYWFDYGSTWTAGPNPLAGSTSSERWFTTQTITGTIGSSSTNAFKYQHQFYLTMQVTPSGSGTVTPSSGWYNAGQSVTIGATAKIGHRFQSWTGTGTGSYTGTSSSHTITMNSPITETANFT